ncbi:hypothetical protein B296_00059145 [Ensete ventricosum]|uniref:Uncharacterized protein n=1 Tax=Ensete ventricosum TaxID=4639 RepID=A0A426X966_ENSVE|nr:hypothetical protein B296_00059145 [Ensete ventricosum]
MEMSPGGDMVQRIMVEQFKAMQHTLEKSCEGLDHTKVVERDEEAATSLEGLSYPKQVLVIIEVDSKECYSVVEADLSITKKGMQMRGDG